MTGRREQLTRRGFRTATEAGVARRELVAQVDRGQLKPGARGTTVNQLLDLYLDGLDADCRLSAKTRFDYRHLADDYVLQAGAQAADEAPAGGRVMRTADAEHRRRARSDRSGRGLA